MATQADIDAVDTAIRKVMSSGQRYTLPNGMTVDRANLQTMIALRDKLKLELTAENNGGVYFPVAILND